MRHRSCLETLLFRHVDNGLAERPALVEVHGEDRRQLSYGELLDLTERLSAELTMLNRATNPGMIALVGSSTLEFVAAWLSVMHAGHAALLLPPGQPNAWYRALWSRLNPLAVFTDRTVDDDTIDGAALPLLPNWPGRAGARRRPRPHPNSAMQPDSAALALLTSGSTGVPKVCLHTHRSIIDFARHVTVPRWGIGRDDRVLATAGPFFSFGLQGIHVPLSVGATAILWPRRQQHAQLLDIVQDESVTVTLAVPTLYQILWHQATLTHRPIARGLRLSLSAGEHLPDRIRERWESFSGSRILNSIGCTETFGPYLSEDCSAADCLLRSVPGFEYQYAASTSMEQTGDSALRIKLRGPSLLPGYYGQPRAALDWFDTGDLFEAVGDGYRFVARATERVKVYGHWVAPSDLEDHLYAQPGVASAAVVPRANEDGLLRLRAYVVLSEEAAADPQGWLTRAQLRLRQDVTLHALRPDRIELVSTLPLTASGKVRRQALQQTDAGRCTGPS